jgi:hypothetical protein
MSAIQAEISVKGVCFGVAVALAAFAIFMCRQLQPKFYGLLFWALFLTLGAAFTYGLYSSLLESFLAMQSKNDQVLAAKSRLAENMRLLAFIVPALMLAVAANLITSFLQAPSPKKRMSES